MDLIHFNNSEDLFKENRFVFQEVPGDADGTPAPAANPAEGEEAKPAESEDKEDEAIDYKAKLAEANTKLTALEDALASKVGDENITKKTRIELQELQQQLIPIREGIDALKPDNIKEADQGTIQSFSEQISQMTTPGQLETLTTASGELKAKIDEKRQALELKKAEITTEAVIAKVMEGLAISNDDIAAAVKAKITDTKSGEIQSAITQKVSTLDAILTEADTTLDPTTVDLEEWGTTYDQTTVDYSIDDYATLIDTAPFEGANDAIAALKELPGVGTHATAAKEKAIQEIVKAIESSTGDIDFKDIIHNEKQDIINAHIADKIGETPEKIAGALNKYALGSYEALSTENREILKKIFTAEITGVNLVGFQGETDGTDWQKRTSPEFHKGQAATLRKVLDYGSNLAGNKTLDRDLIEKYIKLADEGKGWEFFNPGGTFDQGRYDAFFKGGGYFDTALSFQRAENMKRTKGQILAEAAPTEEEKAAILESHKNLDSQTDQLYLRQNGGEDNPDQRVSKLLFDVAEVKDDTPDFGTQEIAAIKSSDYFTKQGLTDTSDDAILRAAQEEAKESKWEGESPTELAEKPAFRKAVVDRLKANVDDGPDGNPDGATEDLDESAQILPETIGNVRWMIEADPRFILPNEISNADIEAALKQAYREMNPDDVMLRADINDEATLYIAVDILYAREIGHEDLVSTELSPDNIPDLMYAQLEEIINADNRFSAAVPQEQMETALIRAMSEVAADGTQLDASDPTIVQDILHTAANILAVDLSEGEDVDDSENAGAQWDVLDVAPNQGDAITVELPGLMENIQVDVPRAAITELKIIASDSSPIQYLYSDEYIAQKIAEAHNTYQQMTPYMGVSFNDRNILELAVSLLDPDKSQEGTGDVVNEGGDGPGKDALNPSSGGVEAPAGVEIEMPDVIGYYIQAGVLFHDKQYVYGDDVYVKFKEGHANKETAITDRFNMNDLALKVWPDGTITAEGTSSEYTNPADSTAPMFVELVLKTPDADPTNVDSWMYSDVTTQSIVEAEGKID